MVIFRLYFGLRSSREADRTYEFLARLFKCVRLFEFAFFFPKFFDVLLNLLVLVELALDVLYELREEALVLAVGTTACVDVYPLCGRLEVVKVMKVSVKLKFNKI